MALFLPSLFPLFRLFLSFRRAYIYTHIYRSVLPSLVSSLFTLAALLSVRISNNTQATLAPLFAAAAHEYARENIDQPYPLLSKQPPWPHPPPFIRLCPPSRINRPSLHGGFSLVNLQPLPFLPSRQGWKNSFLFDTPRNIGSNERALTPSSSASCISLHPWQG